MEMKESMVSSQRYAVLCRRIVKLKEARIDSAMAMELIGAVSIVAEDH